MPAVDTTLQQLDGLLADSCWRSAELLGSLLFSTAKSERKNDHGNYVRVATRYASALSGMQDLWRALFHYELAIKAFPQAGDCGVDIKDVRYRAARIAMQLKKYTQVISLLDAVPEEERTAGMHMLLGDATLQVVVDIETPPQVIQHYLAAVTANPYCIDAYVCLVKAGMPATAVADYVPAEAKASVWPAIGPLIEAHASIKQHEYNKAVKQLDDVAQLYPGNAHVLLNKARSYVQTRSMDPAEKTFEFVCQIDPYCIESMDTYASVLRARGSTQRLSSLVREVVEHHPNRPETWVCAAIYSDLKGDTPGSQEYIERALRIDPRHEVAHLAKGALALQVMNLDAAVNCFRSSRFIHRSLDAFEGLVEAYLMHNPPQYKNALCVAKEALQFMPRNSRALTLVGRVLSLNPEGHSKAHKAFRNALALDPGAAHTITYLVDLLVLQDKIDEAIALLKQQIQKTSTEVLHIKLGDALTSSGAYHEALTHYHIALSLNGRSQAARQGLTRCERVMKGLDPDNPQEDSDGELGEYMLD